MLSSPPSSSRKAKRSELPESPCGTEVSIVDEPWENSTGEAPGDSSLASSLGDVGEFLLKGDLGLELERLNYFWRFCVGSIGALDIVACILPTFLRYCGDSSGNVGFCSVTQNAFHEVLNDLATSLDRHDTTIAFIFSAAWFVDAFLAAHARRKSVLLDEERRRCLGKEPAATSRRPWSQTPTFVYYRSMIFQLLLLPVGFYCLFFYAIDGLLHMKAIEDLEDINHFISRKISPDHQEYEYERFSRSSVLFAVIQQVVLKISGLTIRVVRSRIIDFMQRMRPVVIKTVLSTAIRNPRRFQRGLRKALTAVRWIKYLAPLIGAVNKLKENVDDMMKKRRQKRIADKQRKVRQLLWDRSPIHIREEGAAIMIQSAFRAHRSRKAINGLKSLQRSAKYVASIKIQRALKDSLYRARLRLQKKTTEFRRLCVIHQDMKEELDHDAKKRLFELQDELCEEAKRLINKRLLMRPNTRFSVAWKAVFIVCIIVEVAQLASKPWLESYKNHGKGQPMTMPEFIALSFTPTRASHREECGYKPEPKGILPQGLVRNWQRRNGLSNMDVENLPWYCTHPGSLIQEAYSDVVSLLLVPIPVSEWPDCRETKHRWRKSNRGESRRWYCHEPYSYLHSIYRDIFDFLMDEFLIIVGLVCFLDVFVTFFTGELDELTGELVPKPFFARWVIPGIAIQLLLNPQLDSLALCMARIWDGVLSVGPVRVLRWCATTIVPITSYLWKKFTRYIWMPLVKYENEVTAFVDELF